MSFSGDPSVKIVTRPPHLALAQDVRCDKRRHRVRWFIVLTFGHLAVMRLHNNTNKTHDIEVNADENDEPSDSVSPFVHLTSCARAKWGGLVTTFTLGSSLKLIGIHHLPTRQVTNRL